MNEPIYVHHSSLSREKREESEEEFYQGKEACIVCTSTMELGIDVGDLDKVLQVNCPATVSSFLQRMGRTGRRLETEMNTTFFIEKETKLLQAIAIVELARSGWVENININKLGLYFGKIEHNEIRLSIEGSQIVGEKATKNILEISKEDSREWLRGFDLETNENLSGFVIIKNNNDFYGTGKIKEGRILNFVPKGRKLKSKD